MINRRLEAVLLDMGGVLIPEAGYSAAARNPTLQSHLTRLGVEDPESLAREAGSRIREAYRALEEQCEQPDPYQVLADLDPLVVRPLLRAFAYEAARPPYAHVREVVATLARRHPLGLVSNTVLPGDHHARRLRLYGILPHIRAARWSANFGRRKPDPAIVHAVLAELGVPPDRAILVGDKIRTDVRAAQRAGVGSVWLRRDLDFRQPGDDPQPDYVIQDLRELPALILRIGGA
jgi:putative hydrolase of the HAD superfamily